jgi:hypothetical protein
MSPMHGAPHGAIWVVLEKQMVLPIDVDQAIGVVHPTFCRCEVVAGMELLRGAWRKLNFLLAA